MISRTASLIDTVSGISVDVTLVLNWLRETNHEARFVPSRDWRISIQDILQSIAGIERRTASMTFEEFQRDETVTKAVLYDFVIISEATGE